MKDVEIEAIPLAIPLSADVGRLRQHFEQAYRLNEQQVELMVHSSSQSLKIALAAAENALQENSIDAIRQVGHSLKGLLLNMGEPDWAKVAQRIERCAKEGITINFAEQFAQIRQGMAAVVGYQSQV